MVLKGPNSAAGKKNSHGRYEVEENVSRHTQITHTYLLAFKPLKVYTDAIDAHIVDCHQEERK